MKYYTFGNFLRGIEDSKQIINQRIEDARIFYEKFYKNFEFRNCPICNGNDFSVMPKFLEIYEICRCNICNSVYSNLVPSNEALAWYYNNCKSNAMYADLNKTKKTQEKYMERVEFIIEQLRDYCGNTQNQEINILEVGCNNGALLSLLNDYLKKENLNKKIKIYGIDLDETVIAECKKQQIEGGGGFYVMNASSIGVLGIKFDFVLHYELLEHLPKPSEFVQSIYKNLKEKGRMIFTTPNYLGLEAQALDYNKEERLQVHSIFPPMHLNAFSTQNILYFARINNFRLKYLDTPGKLDFAAVEFCREQMENLDLKEVVKAISVLEDEIKGSIQYLISYLKGSTYMRVVFEK